MSTDCRGDDLLGTIAVIILLVGTATGNAYAMLGISVAALLLIAIFRRKQIGRGAILVALVAAVTATLISIFNGHGIIPEAWEHMPQLRAVAYPAFPPAW